MELAGLALSAVALTGSIVVLGERLADDYSAFQEADEATGTMRLKMGLQSGRTRAYRAILLGNSFSETGYDSSCLFGQLGTETQLHIVNILRQFHQLISIKYDSIRDRFQIIELHGETGRITPDPISQTLALKNRLRWVLWDRKRAATLLEEYTYWNEALFAIIQLHYHARLMREMAGEHRPKMSAGHPSVILDRPDARNLDLENETKMVVVAAGVDSYPIVQEIAKDDFKFRYASHYRKIGTYGQDPVIVEYKDYEPRQDGQPSKAVKERVRQLAALLSTPTSHRFRVLACRGWIHCPESQSFGFVFQLPPGDVKSSSLQTYLAGKSSDGPALEDRFKLAHTIALSLSQFFAVGWVHKSLRSGNIMFFHPDGIGPDWASPWLMGFDYCRPESEFSSQDAADSFEMNIYRHPEQWGYPTEHFSKKHDIYALGVMMLEIGYWKSAVKLSLSSESKNGRYVMDSHIRSASSRRLRIAMGSRYQKVVLACLKFDFHQGQDANQGDIELQERFREQVGLETVPLDPLLTATKVIDILNKAASGL
ncbi:MAG: hypothetical protein M1840_001460 [Geoglossum simile]|nr:MAG: hypothetical protein M1840_001460 [Geoglossum simile]